MAKDFRKAPHPLLKEAVLYFPEVPKNVPWASVIQVFSSCGTVLSAGKHNAVPDSKAWVVRFRDVFEAEMALATLQGAVIPNTTPPIALALSHTPELASVAPLQPLLPQFVQSNLAAHPLQRASPQDVFRWFRSSGPLVSVQTDVDVGHGNRTCVVEHWEEEHARYAKTQGKSLHAPLKTMPAFGLRTFDPCNLYCAKLGSAFKQEDFEKHFGKFGDIVVARLMNVGTVEAYGFISFRTQDQASGAMRALNGKVVGISPLQVRCHEPKWQWNFRIPSNARTNPEQKAQPKAKDANSAQASSHDQEKSPANDETRRLEEEENKRKKAEELKQQEEAQRKQAEQEQQKKVEEEARRKKQEEEEKRKLEQEQERLKREQEAEAAKAAEQRARERQTKRDAAESKCLAAVAAHASAEARLVSFEIEHTGAKAQRTTAESEASAATTALKDAVRAVQEAERLLAEAKQRLMDAARRAGDATIARVHAQAAEQETSVRVHAAVQDERNAKVEMEMAEREERDVLEETAAAEEEERRQQELAESIRKMRELREVEEAEQREREEKTRQQEAEKLRKLAAERLARAERERQAREEAERLERQAREEAERLERQAREEAERRERKAREEAERLEREKKEREEQEAKRQKGYEEASAEELTRCKKRDYEKWNVHKFTLWTKERSIDRFVAVSLEFDETRFCERQPLTSLSVPWPTLQSPARLQLGEIEWGAVEEFFGAAKLAVGANEYKVMVEKAHRRFHPDKWRARGLLKTVLDDELRTQLENAGNIVAQAITPLWLASKSR